MLPPQTVIENQPPESKKVNHALELNSGLAFGGDDGEQLMQGFKKTTDEFKDELEKGNSHALTKLVDFLDFIKMAETEGPGRNLMSENMTRKAKILIENARKKEKKRIIIAVTDETYLGKNEEDFKLREKIRELTKDTGSPVCDLVTVEKLMIAFMTGETAEDEIFPYYGFTGPELVQYCQDKSYDTEKVTKSIMSMDSLDPLEIEDKTGRAFVEKLNIPEEQFELFNAPIAKKELSFKEESGKITIYRNGEVFNLENLIFKEEGTFGGEVRFYKHQKSKFSFDEEFIKAKLEDEKSDFYFEDLVTLPRVPVPLSEDNKQYSENLKIVDLDVRTGYVYDPTTKQIINLSLYIRFNNLAIPNNIAKGGGVMPGIVIKDKYYKEAKLKMLELMRSLSAEEAKWFYDQFGKNLMELGFEEKGNVIPYSPLPFFITETRLEYINQHALEVGRKIVAARDDSKANESVAYALDLSIKPN